MLKKIFLLLCLASSSLIFSCLRNLSEKPFLRNRCCPHQTVDTFVARALGTILFITTEGKFFAAFRAAMFFAGAHIFENAQKNNPVRVVPLQPGLAPNQQQAPLSDYPAGADQV